MAHQCISVAWNQLQNARTYMCEEHRKEINQITQHLDVLLRKIYPDEVPIVGLSCDLALLFPEWRSE